MTRNVTLYDKGGRGLRQEELNMYLKLQKKIVRTLLFVALKSMLSNYVCTKHAKDVFQQYNVSLHIDQYLGLQKHSLLCLAHLIKIFRKASLGSMKQGCNNVLLK